MCTVCEVLIVSIKGAHIPFATIATDDSEPHHVDAGTQTQDLCKSIKCSYPVSCDSKPYVEAFYDSII